MSAVRYEHVHHNRLDTSQAKSIDDFIKLFEENLALFKRWQEKGIMLDPHRVSNTYAIFYTYDEAVAKEEGFERFRTEAGNPLPRR